MQFVKFASTIEQFRKIFQSPKAHGFGEGIEEEERPITVVDELDESAIAEFIAQNDVGPQSDLIGRQLRECIGSEGSTGLMGDGIDHSLQKGIHTALGGLPQSGIRKAYFHCLISSIMVFIPLIFSPATCLSRVDKALRSTAT